MVPTVVENSKFFVYLFVNFFVKNIIMTGAPTHTVKEMECIHYALLSVMFNPLHSSTNQELFEKHLYKSK